MKKYYLLLSLLLATFLKATLCFSSIAPSALNTLKQSEQLILVISPNWNSFQGTLQFYQRKSPE